MCIFIYHIQLCLVPKTTNIFLNSWGGLYNGDFLFSKIIQLFTKRVIRGLFDYYGIVSKDKKWKIRRSSSQ